MQRIDSVPASAQDGPSVHDRRHHRALAGSDGAVDLTRPSSNELEWGWGHDVMVQVISMILIPNEGWGGGGGSSGLYATRQ